LNGCSVGLARSAYRVRYMRMTHQW